MATIDQLNFEVILDDKEFNAKVKEDIRLANELNTSLSQLLTIKNKVGKFTQDDVNNNRKANKILEDNAKTQEKITREKDKTRAMQDKLNASIQRATKSYQVQSRILNELKGYALGYLSVHGASQLLSSLVRVTGEFELQKTTLAAMIGDLNTAENIIAKIQGLAVESPFQFKELTTYAKQLSAFSVPAQELYNTTKMLADVSAGLGVGMDRIVLAYGQVRSAAFLRGQEVRQFTEAGIPILDELAKQFTELEGRAVSTGEVFDKISARLVPFEMVAKVFKDMTSEGGKFYNMQEVQAETLRGKLSNLKDAYEVMLNEIGSAHSDKLKGAIDGVRKLMQNWEAIGGQLVDLIKLFGIYKAAAALLGISDTIAKFGGLAKAIKGAAMAQKLMNSALMTNPYVAVGMAITTVALAINRHRKALGDTSRAQNEYNERVRELERIDRERTTAIRNLIDTVQDETKATIEREAALMSLKDSYPEIFAQYDIESLKLADILKIKKQIAEEDAKQKKLSALGGIAAQEGRLKALVARGAGQSYKDDAFKLLQEMEKDYLSKYVLPDIVASFRDYTDDALKTALEDAFRKSQYKTRGVEVFDNVPTSQDFYNEMVLAIQAEINRRKNVKLTTGWRKEVQDLLTSMQLDEQHSFGLWAKDTTQATTYVEDMIKRYKELKEQIKWVSSFDPQLADTLKKELATIEAVAKKLKVDIVNLSAKKSDTTESKEERRIKAQIELVRKLQAAHESLTPYLSGDKMKSVLSSIFPEAEKEWIDSFDFDKVLDNLLKELGAYNNEAANKLKTSIGKDVASGLADAFKEIEAYKKMLDSWMGEDFNLTGKGTGFDISKILRDLNNQYAQIDQKRLRALELLKKAELGDAEAIAIVREHLGEKFWKDYITNGSAAIDLLVKKEKQSAKEIADEKIRDKATSYMKELLDERNIDLSDLGEKSMGQLSTLIDRMKELQVELSKDMGDLAVQMLGGELDEGQKAKWDMLAKVIEMLGLKIKDVGVELEESLFDNLSESIGLIGDLGSEIANLGDAIGLSRISEFGNELSDISELVDKIIPQVEKLYDEFSSAGIEIKKITGTTKKGKEYTKGFESNTKWKDLSDSAKLGIASIVASVASYAISKVADMIANAREQQLLLNEATLKYRDAMLEVRRSSYEGIFGTEELGLAAENAKILAEAQQKYADSLDQFENNKKLRRNKYNQDSIAFKKMSVSEVLGDIAKFQGWELYRENGELNMQMLIAYYDAYSEHLTNKQRDTVDALIESYNAQNDAAAQSAEYMTSVFSNAADTIANDMVNAFIESGDAAIDLRSVVSDVASTMASDLIKSLYIMPILNDYAQELKGITEDTNLNADEKTARALAVFQNAVDEIEGNKNAINETLEILDEYFLREEKGGADLGEGIKGITEDQANLLASYLNAIRADVSYSKALWVRMDANLQRIADMFASSPTLMEYQAQIAANTFDTAQATQAILGELRSVMTSDGGDTAIRIYS